MMKFNQKFLFRFEKIVQLLVDAGANVNILNPDTGTSALHHAAARCSLSATQLLVKHGAIVDKISSTGATALHEAAHSGAYQVKKSGFKIFCIFYNLSRRKKF